MRNLNDPTEEITRYCPDCGEKQWQDNCGNWFHWETGLIDCIEE
jgi:hypothetical protein